MQFFSTVLAGKRNNFCWTRARALLRVAPGSPLRCCALRARFPFTRRRPRRRPLTGSYVQPRCPLPPAALPRRSRSACSLAARSPPRAGRRRRGRPCGGGGKAAGRGQRPPSEAQGHSGTAGERFPPQGRGRRPLRPLGPVLTDSGGWARPPHFLLKGFCVCSVRSACPAGRGVVFRPGAVSTPSSRGGCWQSRARQRRGGCRPFKAPLGPLLLRRASANERAAAAGALRRRRPRRPMRARGARRARPPAAAGGGRRAARRRR